MTPSRAPALFVGHGAAVFTTDPADPTNRFLSGFAATVTGWKPSGIVIISAHDEARPLRVTGAGPLQTIHDHPARAVYGFDYPAKGTTALTEQVCQAMAVIGLGVDVASGKGLDHGAWVPLSLLHPSAELPIAQLSLMAGAGPEEHVAVGRALTVLRDQGVLLIGSGGVTHSQRVFREGFFAGADVATPQPFSTAFEAFVTEAVTTQRGAQRTATLAAYERHPHAAQAHPTPEHFSPLLVIAGAAGDDVAVKRSQGFQHSLSTAVFQFG
jgi:4,5-DOPA dioxygenase extradiol